MIISPVKNFVKFYSHSSAPVISTFFKSLLFILRLVHSTPQRVQLFYESYISKILAIYFFMPYLPLSKWFNRQDIWLVSNVANGVGHVTVEFDYFFHMLKSGDIPPNRRYIIILKKTELYSTFVELYGHCFAFATAKTWLYNLLLPLLMRYEKKVDVGISRMKWHIPAPLGYHVTFKHPFAYQLRLQPALQQIKCYYLHRKKSPSSFPLIEHLPTEAWTQAKTLQTNLGLKPDSKICLVQLKSGVVIVNATAKPTDPASYLPTLEYLTKEGYQLVFCGREKMPDIFKKSNITNYAESRFVSFKNDILLFNLSSLAITGGSGISFLADCYNKPILYLNTWHLSMSLCNKLSICIPTLINKNDSTPLTFKEQIDVFMRTSTVDDKFPQETFSARNATEDEILEGMKELLRLTIFDNPLHPIQAQFNELDNQQGLLSETQSRVSSYFLLKHRQRFT